VSVCNRWKDREDGEGVVKRQRAAGSESSAWETADVSWWCWDSLISSGQCQSTNQVRHDSYSGQLAIVLLYCCLSSLYVKCMRSSDIHYFFWFKRSLFWRNWSCSANNSSYCYPFICSRSTTSALSCYCILVLFFPVAAPTLWNKLSRVEIVARTLIPGGVFASKRWSVSTVCADLRGSTFIPRWLALLAGRYRFLENHWVE